MAEAALGPDEPTPDIDSEHWWAALNDQRLTVNRCGACGAASLYVRAFCPVCWSEDVALEEVSGRGTLYTWSVVHQNAAPFADRTPYIAAIVDLDEGPRLMSVVERCPESALRAGLALQVAFRETEAGQKIPVFRPS